MASPPSDADTATNKVTKDRKCPFCGQEFTSSSLGRHLDLYIKSKNPKAPDGIHDVEKIKQMRGSITRRQSRVASIKRDSSVPAGPASAKYALDDKGAGSSDTPRRVIWSVNKPGWEATGVMNDLPPRIEPRPVADRRDSSKREQLKADLDQRQKLADELDTGRAAQLALKEILDTVRNAEASATGRHLFDDFEFFQQSFPALCLRLLAPAVAFTSSLCIDPSSSWSSSPPWESQRDALGRAVEERGQLLKRKDSLLSSAYDDASGTDLNLDKFHEHIARVFELWKQERNRNEVWQQEIIRNYARLASELKEANAAIRNLKRERELELMASRIERGSSDFSPYQATFADRLSMSIPASPIGLSDEVLKDLRRQGVNERQWEYERLLDRWRNVVRDERRTSSGLRAQRNFSTTSSQAAPRTLPPTSNLSVNGGVDSTISRSDSVTSAMSAIAPTRTSSVDSAALDADAEGEEEDMEADNVAPDAHSYTRKLQEHVQQQTRMPSGSGHPLQNMQLNAQHQGAPAAQMIPDPRLSGMPHQHSQTHLDQNYKWPQQQHGAQPMTNTSYHEQGTVRRLPPGPDSWHAEIHHAASHSMEGLEGPATTGAAPASVG